MIDPDVPSTMRPVADEIDRCAISLGLGRKIEVYPVQGDSLRIQLRYIKQSPVALSTRVYVRKPIDENQTGPPGMYLVYADRGYDQYSWPREAAQEAFVMLLQRMIEDGEPALDL